MALKYIGPLFGQIGRRHIPLEMHSDDVDKMEIELSSLRSALAVAQSRVSECSDREALLADNIELRSALAEKTKEVERLREALEDIRDNYDCDEDAHKYGTRCRCCIAHEALAGDLGGSR